ncbi:MAG TPA: DUF885 domain-containing protein [Thermoplasmata archaeon]|nr:DUF885 domain-containing protein [Thermoplasmata archaeon]
MSVSTPPKEEVAEFEAVEKAIIDHVFRLQPGYAVFVGLHEYDGRLPDYSPAATGRWIAEADALLRRLLRISHQDLPRERRMDRTTIGLLLESPLFDLTEARDLERNPMVYVGAPSLTQYMIREYGPVPARVDAIVRTLEGTPRLLDEGRRRLRDRLPAPFLKLSLAIGEGLPSHFREAEAFARRFSPELGEKVAAVRPAAEAAVESFLARVRDEWTKKADDDFAMGPTRYQRLLWVREGITRPFSELLADGERDLARNQARLQEIAQAATPPVGVPELLETLYRDHPTAAELVPTAQRYVAETRQFVVDRRLVTIPEPDSCRVEETPTYGRALSTASMNPPGPLETSGDEGIYFVTPIDAAWSPERQEQWLRSLNRPMLRNITAHEVYPGHYLQFLHHRKGAATLARKVFMSNSFTEGWAHYCEQLCIEAGLGAGSASAEVAELHDALLRDCRLIVSVGLHTGHMSLEQATEVLMREAHFERLPAEREAIRGTFNPEYFCYTLGKLAILRAREKYLHRRFQGSLMAFHDQLLSCGAPPVGLLDQLFD